MLNEAVVDVLFDSIVVVALIVDDGCCVVLVVVDPVNPSVAVDIDNVVELLLNGVFVDVLLDSIVVVALIVVIGCPDVVLEVVDWVNGSVVVFDIDNVVELLLNGAVVDVLLDSIVVVPLIVVIGCPDVVLEVVDWVNGSVVVFDIDNVVELLLNGAVIEVLLDSIVVVALIVVIGCPDVVLEVVDWVNGSVVVFDIDNVVELLLNWAVVEVLWDSIIDVALIVVIGCPDVVLEVVDWVNGLVVVFDTDNVVELLPNGTVVAVLLDRIVVVTLIVGNGCCVVLVVVDPVNPSVGVFDIENVVELLLNGAVIEVLLDSIVVVPLIVVIGCPDVVLEVVDWVNG